MEKYSLYTFLVSKKPEDRAGADLYEVLKRANLLSYNKKFYAQGIESPHEVYKANKEEFAEIMRHVGMASTPGHVLRFKKSMDEWADEQGMHTAERHLSHTLNFETL